MGQLQAVLGYLIAMSLASERLVTIIKTLFPSLSVEHKTEAQEVDLKADRPRRLILQAIAFVASWLTVGLSTAAANPERQLTLGLFDPLRVVDLGSVALPVIVLAILTSGGSAMWNNVLSYTKALKDTKQVEKASETFRFHSLTRESGTPALAAGETVGVNTTSTFSSFQKTRNSFARFSRSPGPSQIPD